MGAPFTQQQAPQQSGRVVIFESAHDGYGDAIRDDLRYIFPRRNRRPYSYNRVFGAMDARSHGGVAIGNVMSAITLSTFSSAGPPIFAKEWEDTVPNSLLIAVYPKNAGGNVVTVQSAVVTTEAALGALPTGAVLHDDGAGVPYLYIGFGGSSATKIKKRDRAGTVTACTNLYGDKLLSINNDLYVSFTPASGTANCAIGKVPAGTNPSTAAQPAATIVSPRYNINSIAPDGTGMYPVALTPDGIFTYDRALDVWRNRVSSWVTHPDNGKAYWHEDGDLCVALGQGGAVRFNGTDVIPYDAIPLYAVPDHDTTSQLIGAAGNTRHWGALVTKAGSKRQRTGGTAGGTALIDVGKTTDGATYTDYSTVASDGNPTTVITLSALNTVANNNWIVVGHVQPFSGIYFDMLAKNAAASGIASIDIWNGTDWIPVATTDLTNIQWITTPLGRAAWMLMTEDPVVLGWQPRTLTVGSSKTRYWARVSITGVVLTTPTTVKGVELLPYRPSIDATNFANDGLDRSSNFPHLLFSRMSEDGEHVTHDYGVINSGGTPVADEITAVVYGPGGGDSRNDDRGLYLFGMRAIYALQLSLDDRPALTSWPLLSTQGLVEFPSLDLGENANIEDFKIEAVEWNGTGYLYYRFEDGRPWTRAGIFSTVPATLPGASAAVGRYLKVAVGGVLTAAQAAPVGRPRVLFIDCQPRPSKEKRGQLAAQKPPIV